MSSYWTAAFWRGAAERAVKTLGQSAGAYLSAGQLGLLEVDWLGLGSVAGLAALLSLFQSVGNADFVAGTVRVTE